jgi:DMSO/TMAO reductase YedYZ molybdopterin-dependent catalytic subunit
VNANSGTNSKFSKKILALIAIIIVVVAAAVVSWQYVLQQPTTSPSPSLTPSPSSSPSIVLPTLTLTVVGGNGTQVTLNETSMATLESYSGPAGFKSSGGLIAAVGTYTGVPVLTLLNLVGGISSDQTLTVTASDGYSMVYTYSQVQGRDFTTYDPVTGSEKAPTQNMTLCVNYFCNGTALPSDQGPLRIGVVGPEGLLTEGHFWTKMTAKLEVTNNIRDWTVTVNATNFAPLSMDRQAWTADYNHFTLNWTDSNSNIWTGTALWRWVSWYNYNGGVSNATLDQGYSVKLVSGDGSYVTLDDSKVKLNDNIIMAGKLNGAILSDPYWPLTLVGSDVTNEQMAKNIVGIEIVLDHPSAATPTPTVAPTATPTAVPTQTPIVTAQPTPTPTVAPSGAPTASPTATPTPTPSPVPVAEYNLILNGTAVRNMTRTDFEAQVASVTSSFTDSNGGVYTGTPLHRIIVWAENNGAANSTVDADGYVVKVIASDGSTLTLNDSRINMNTNIFLANKYNGAALNTTTGWPLRLTGTDLNLGSQRLKSVVQIQILPIWRNITLTIVAKNGTSYTLFSNDIINMASYAANGGTRSSSGNLANYGTYTGISMANIVSLYGGSSSSTIKVTGSDAYSTTYSYGQLSGQGVLSYNSAGTQVTPAQSQTMILAYYLNGASIGSSNGPLRTIIVGPEGYYTTGSTSAKLVAKIEIL